MLRETTRTHSLDPPHHPTHPLHVAHETGGAGGAGREGVLGMDLQYRVRSPQQILVRLRVDHFGFPTIHQQRFGAQFVGLIANPDTVLTFTKKKKEGPRLIKQPQKAGEKNRGKSSTCNGQGPEDASGGRGSIPIPTLTFAPTLYVSNCPLLHLRLTVRRQQCECGGPGGCPPADAQQGPDAAAGGRPGAGAGELRRQAQLHLGGGPRERDAGPHTGGRWKEVVEFRVSGLMGWG